MTFMPAQPYRTHDHGSFDEEWGLHQGVSEWWYITGYFSDESDRMFSYQFTLIRPHVLGITPNVIMLALTDFSSEKHFYSQKTSLSAKGILINQHTVQVGDVASLTRGEKAMQFNGRHRNYSLDLSLDYGKGAFWHCDNGVLRMGLDMPNETTLYYSYPNLSTSGTLTLEGKTFSVKGKSWFDKQGGPYSIMNRMTHWEWFSLRFFDNEEMMLFTFPQSSYQDGTYIPCQGQARRLADYTITPVDFVLVNQVKFSSGWTLEVPGIKEEHYTIQPLMKGQMNLAYFEQLAGIYNRRREQVGLCFIELLPGVYNRINPLRLFAKVE